MNIEIILLWAVILLTFFLPALYIILRKAVRQILEKEDESPALIAWAVESLITRLAERVDALENIKAEERIGRLERICAQLERSESTQSPL